MLTPKYKIVYSNGQSDNTKNVAYTDDANMASMLISSIVNNELSYFGSLTIGVSFDRGGPEYEESEGYRNGIN